MKIEIFLPKFLTAGKNGVPERQEWFDSPNQKFVFTSSTSTFLICNRRYFLWIENDKNKNISENNESSWKLTPIDEKNAITDHYKITDVGHGKYQLKSFSSGKCLQAQG